MLKNRILMIGPVDISGEFGSKVHFSNLVKNFEKLGLKTRSIMYLPAKPLKDKEGSGLDIRFVPNPLLGNKIKRLLKYIMIIPLMSVEVFSFKPEIIYFRFSPPAFLYLFVLRMVRFFCNNYKIMVEFNDWISEERAIQGESKIKVKLMDFLQVRSAFFADYARVVAPGIKENLVIRGIDNKKVFVIENGTDVNHFRPINKEEAKKRVGLDPDCLYIGFIGNFAVWQGVTFILKIIPGVLKEFSNVRFLLVGDGFEMGEVKRKVREFKGDNVKVTGFVPYKEANLYINSFDIGLAPYIKDIGFSPLKIRDYAACGVPIISSKIKGAQFVEDTGIGILFPVGDVEALSESIKKLIKDTDLRKNMGHKGRKLAEEKLSWEYITKKILNLTEH